jgi:hypothetical protein
VRTAAIIAALLIGCWGAAGCGGSGSSSSGLGRPALSAASQRYSSELAGAQARLAAAERKLPLGPRTPAALSNSIGLLAGAIARLGDDLQRIAAPASVSREHGRLITIVRGYRAQLERAAADARAPGGVGRAGSELVAATTAASSSFDATVARIDARLR